jgi:hypothetical protein
LADEAVAAATALRKPAAQLSPIVGLFTLFYSDEGKNAMGYVKYRYSLKRFGVPDLASMRQRVITGTNLNLATL